MNEISTTVLEKCVTCFTAARQNLIEGAKYLHEISHAKLWQDNYNSFGEFVEQECQISQGFASKLISVYEHYLVAGGVSQRNLENVDAEKLYLASKLPGTPEEQLTKALTLSRGELKQQKQFEDTGAECTHPSLICAKCHSKV